jgi:hypothetical protein
LPGFNRGWAGLWAAAEYNAAVRRRVVVSLAILFDSRVSTSLSR